MKYDIDEIIEYGNKFYDNMKQDDYSRYRSWEHCYKIFYKVHKENSLKEHMDELCLNLAFYLASWGMLRNSFLLYNDYKIYGKIINILFDKDYSDLWNIKIDMYNDELIDKLYGKEKSLTYKLRKELFKIRDTVYDKRKDLYKDLDDDEDKPKNEVSDTLVTKILLGTLGCVPAYDRFLVFALRKFDIVGKYGKNSIKDIKKFYLDNKDKLDKEINKLKIDNIPFPQMKYIDSCFWQYGYDNIKE